MSKRRGKRKGKAPKEDAKTGKKGSKDEQELSEEQKNKLFRTGLNLEYFTVGYNVLEATFSIIFAVIAGSVVLFGFGLDAVVESLAGGILVWRLLMHGRVATEKEERFEFIAHRLVAVTFLILAAYILFDSATTLYFKDKPDVSWPGVTIAIVSILVMPVLANWKKKVGQKIGSKALIADSKETMVCWVLSFILLAGLVLNALFGWWWADPVMGLGIVMFLVKEGIEEWREAGEDDDDDDD